MYTKAFCMLIQALPLVLSFPTDPLGPRASFRHPGALHTSGDFARIKGHVKNETQPWFRAYQHLQASKLAQVTWKATPQTLIVRGAPDPSLNLTQNYGYAYRDAHSAYQQALLWQISNNASYAKAAIATLDAWAATLKGFNGNEDMFLAAGLQGYQFANAGELLRSYNGWPAANQTKFAKMMTDVFAATNRNFLDTHNNKPNFYYANWDFCNIASLMAIGIFTDNSTMYDFAVEYFLNGPIDGSVANGALPFFSIANFTESPGSKVLMEGQEAGRDQGHSLLDFALLGVIAQQGLSQSTDLYGAYGHQILNAAEYAAKYNTNHSVPYKPYVSWEGTLPVVANKSRGDIRPGYEAIFAYYHDVKGWNASWSKEYRDYVARNLTANIEGGGGDYGPNSGGYDALGHGTLMYRHSGN